MPRSVLNSAESHSDLEGSFDFTSRKHTGSLSSGYQLFRKKSISIKLPEISYPDDATLNEKLFILCNKLKVESMRNEEETIVFQSFCFKEVFYLLTELKANKEDIEMESELLSNGAFISLLLEFFKFEEHVQDKNTLRLQFHALKILYFLQCRDRKYSDLIVEERGIPTLIGFLRRHNSHHAHGLSVEVQEQIVVILSLLCTLDEGPMSESSQINREAMIECHILKYVYKLCILLRIHYDSLERAGTWKRARSPRKSLAEWLGLSEKALIRSVAGLFQNLCLVQKGEHISIQLKVTKMLLCCSDSALQKFGAMAFASLSDAAYSSFIAFEEDQTKRYSPICLSLKRFCRKIRKWTLRCCTLCLYAKERLFSEDANRKWVEDSDFIRTRDSTLSTVLNYCLDHSQQAMRTKTALALLRNRNSVIRFMVCHKLKEMVQETKDVDLIGDEVIECLLNEILLRDASNAVITESVHILSALIDIGLATDILIDKKGLHCLLDAIQSADKEDSAVLGDVQCKEVLLEFVLRVIETDPTETGLVNKMSDEGAFEMIKNLEHTQKTPKMNEIINKILSLNPK